MDRRKPAWNSGGSSEADPEGLVVGEEWGTPEEGSGTAARPFLTKNDFFSLETVVYDFMNS